MFSFTKSLLTLIGVLALSGVEARADSFVFTDVQGALFVETSADGGPPTLKLPPNFVFRGPGLTIFTTFPSSGGDVGVVEARDTCIVNGCAPGTIVGTNSMYSGLITPAFGGAARVNGVFFNLVQMNGSLNLVSAPIVIPDNGGTDFSTTIPFTFSGQLTGTAFQQGLTNPIFTVTMSGQGLATFFFELPAFGFSNYRLRAIEYQFQPIPEPATLLLLSSGLAAMIAAARRKY